MFLTFPSLYYDCKTNSNASQYRNYNKNQPLLFIFAKEKLVLIHYSPSIMKIRPIRHFFDDAGADDEVAEMFTVKTLFRIAG